MTLQQLIHRTTWQPIAAALMQQYPAAQRSIFRYKEVYMQLLQMEPAPTDLQVWVERKWDTLTGLMVADVSGRRQIPHVAEAQFSIPFSLQFTSWAEWLAMPVSLRSFQHFSGTEVVAYCLYEMTAIGFDEATIQQKARYLCEVPNDTEAMMDSDGLAFTWEQVIQYLTKTR